MKGLPLCSVVMVTWSLIRKENQAEEGNLEEAVTREVCTSTRAFQPFEVVYEGIKSGMTFCCTRSF